jgi:hypothetical protein
MSKRIYVNRRLALSGIASLSLALAITGGTPISVVASHASGARDDTYQVTAGRQLRVDALRGILANDAGDPATLIVPTDPAHGALQLQPDGAFTYTPNDGFVGTDSFTHTISDAVRLFSTHVPPLATIGDVKITGGGFGSSLYPAPFSPDEFYGVTDRGPMFRRQTAMALNPCPVSIHQSGKSSLDPMVGLIWSGSTLSRMPPGTPTAAASTARTARAKPSWI